MLKQVQHDEGWLNGGIVTQSLAVEVCKRTQTS